MRLGIAKALLVSILGSTASPAWATTYYADNSLGGNCTANYSVANRACNGTDGNAYTTIQAAVNVAIVAGDTVDVRAGTYTERVTTAAGGSAPDAEHYLTIQAHAAETVIIDSSSNGGFTIRHPYVKVDGFDITGSSTAGAYIYIPNGAAVRGDYCYISNNTIHNTDPASSNQVGISISGSSSSESAASHCTIIGNTLNTLFYTYISISGDNHLIANNRISGHGNAAGYNDNDYDAMWLLGNYNTVRGNEIYNFDGRCTDACDSPCSAGCGSHHTDFIQTSGDCGSPACDSSNNNLIEGNYLHDLMGTQICNLDQNPNKPGIGYWTFRNNIFVNVALKANVTIPHVDFFNNTFVNVEASAMGGNDQHPIWFSGYPGSSATEGRVYNNLFIGCGGTRNDQGWYGLYNTASGTASVTADYNFVASSEADGYAAKDGFATGDPEIHGIGGGDPKFVGPLVSAAGFMLSSDSPAKDQGLTIDTFSTDYTGTARPQGAAWDIGAYEFCSAESGCTPPPSPKSSSGCGFGMDSTPGVAIGILIVFSWMRRRQRRAGPLDTQ